MLSFVFITLELVEPQLPSFRGFVGYKQNNVALDSVSCCVALQVQSSASSDDSQALDSSERLSL